MLFWAMFLPLGAYWSVDRASRAQFRGTVAALLSVATFGLFMQIAFVLVCGSWAPSGSGRHRIYYALSLVISTSLGQYLLNFPSLLTGMTFCHVWPANTQAVLAFCPFFTGPVRTELMIFMSLHFGIWFDDGHQDFFLDALCMVCFLPGWFWNKVAGYTYPPKEPRRHRATPTTRQAWRLVHIATFSVADTGQPSVSARRHQRYGIQRKTVAWALQRNECHGKHGARKVHNDSAAGAVSLPATVIARIQPACFPRSSVHPLLEPHDCLRDYA